MKSYTLTELVELLVKARTLDDKYLYTPQFLKYLNELETIK